MKTPPIPRLLHWWTRIAPIPATRQLHQVEENLGAADVELTPAELEEVEAAAARIDSQDGRYAEASERMPNL